MTTFFAKELEGVANFWRVYRQDGVALAFTSHDRDIVIGGLTHRAAPGIAPSAIRRDLSLSNDSAEVEGVLSHDSIAEDDLAAGLFDDALVEIGAVDWESGAASTLYSGTIGNVDNHHNSFSAELKSAKVLLEQDLVPRTSPTCRAEFCGRGCNLSAPQFTSVLQLSAIDWDTNSVTFSGLTAEDYIDGEVRFMDGPQTGLAFGIVDIIGAAFALDRQLARTIEIGTMAMVKQGCDHTLATCQSRFGNSINFRGEPYLPGNDLLSRYPNPN